MENATGGGWADHTQFMEYKVSDVMWKVLSPFILVLGTFGNLATILVMRRIKDNNSTQYVILMVLAMADLCVLYSGLLVLWVAYAYNVDVAGFYNVTCKLLPFASYASTTASAWLVTTMTVQRTMAVLWPHRMRMMCTVRRTWVVIAVLVVTACFVHLHVVIEFHITENKYCGTSFMYMLFYLIWQWVHMCLSSLLPSSCLFVCWTILSWTLFKSTSLSSTAICAMSDVNTDSSNGRRKSEAVKVTVMVLALAGTFLVLTLPVWIYTIWRNLGYVYTPKTAALSAFWRSVTKLMWYSNSAVNFLLYCLTGTRFRKEFMSLLLCGTKGHTVGETTAVTSRGGGSKRQNSTPLST